MHQEPKAEPPPPTVKALKKNAAKPDEKNVKTVEAIKEVPLDPIEEKLRQQRWAYVTHSKKILLPLLIFSVFIILHLHCLATENHS